MNSRDAAIIDMIEYIAEHGRFKASDLDLDVSDSTRRDICRGLEEKGLLYRTSDKSTIWRAGPEALAHLDMSDEAIKAARQTDQ